MRAPQLAATAWAGCVVGLLTPGAVAVAAVTLLALATAALVRRSRLVAACCLLAAGLCGHAALTVDRLDSGPVAAWAQERPIVTVELRATADGVVREGDHGPFALLRAEGTVWTVRGETARVSAPVLVIGDESWGDVAWGDTVHAVARLQPADGHDLAAVLSAVGDPEVEAGRSDVLAGADAVRTSVRTAARDGPGHSDALVPALVTGDDERLPTEVTDDFRTAGLTHLTAVSGTNLTLVLASVLLLARWVGVRARGLLVVGALCVVGFVLVARPEPSVLRAAVMGSVALVGLGSGGRAAGVRALGAAVVVLLALTPAMALSPGFALSVCATAGILVGAPAVRDALASWLPRWLAEAIAVPWAAQMACTPLVAGLSGQVSLVAVVANLLVAPAVGPATVLGLGGGIVGLLVPPLGRVVGWLGCCSAWLILAVAERAARLPGAEVAWPSGSLALVVLVVLSLVGLVGASWVMRHRWLTVAAALLLLVAILRPAPSPGWPPEGWVLVMCDVGQGDALALRTGPAEAVVVDAGPESALVDGCLDDLGVRRVPAVVLTHFHADHVDGLQGVLEGRAVGEVQVTSLREPAYGAEEVDRLAAAHGVPVRVPAVGEQAARGEVSWRVVGPPRVLGENPNDASLVLLVEAGGLRLLLAGDAEPPEQGQLERAGIGDVDVLKVAHHGSRYQDHGFIADLRPQVALVSVGEGNDYGHPAPDLTAWLTDGGVDVRRTDRDGDVAVVVGEDGWGVVSRG
ncbi:MBL fold metallo-hydrolase [Nocardioides sp. HDW12B]|nr:MBL fold metallo-hydrolase [Nocardioides sp. HDW12B]